MEQTMMDDLRFTANLGPRGATTVVDSFDIHTLSVAMTDVMQFSPLYAPK